MNGRSARPIWILLLGLLLGPSSGLAQVDLLLESDVTSLLKGELSLGSDSAAYYPGTVNWIERALVVLSGIHPQWQLPTSGFTPGVFNEALAGAVKKFQQKLSLPQGSGRIDAPTMRALVALCGYGNDRDTLGGMGQMDAEQALKKNLLWAGPGRYYPDRFLEPIYRALQVSAPAAKGSLLLFTPALANAISGAEIGGELPSPGPLLSGYVTLQNYGALMAGSPWAPRAAPGAAAGIEVTKDVGIQGESGATAANQLKLLQAAAKLKVAVKSAKKSQAVASVAANIPTADSVLKGMPLLNLNQAPLGADTRVLYFSVGESRSLRIPGWLSTVAIGNHDIADAKMLSAEQILITAIKNGDTTLSLFFQDGTKEHYVLSVTQSPQHHRTAVFRLKYLNLQQSSVNESYSTLTVKTNTSITDPLTKMLSAIIADVTKFSIFPSLGLVTVRGSDDEISKVAAMLQRLDTPIDQLVIFTQILEVKSDIAESLGFAEAAQANQMDASFQPSSTGGGIVTFTRGASFTTALVSRLTALVTDGKAKTLANPRILAQSGEVSDIYVGRQIPVVSRDTDGNQTFDQIETGIKLLINPRVNDDGTITTWIGTLVSSATTTLYGGLPEIVTRRAQTTLRIDNGETIVLGGLKSSEYSTTVNKFPFLGDIPLLGEFFKGTSSSLKDSDIIITLTPQILAKTVFLNP